ncbi:acetyl-CoA C-acyltransferase [Sporosarcina sp. P16a]|uniref:acetyl-CoA C-acyltransferase n=1 Tax=unclassified Sporosarcina TaxID=2647733 RepID=UPI000C16BF5E|nr:MULTISPECIES: acetyl-CoA C-acyltransferase [unclassified Sporosarcina]PIC67559.1 acetyl-CoA C-acyltransferase [Sporosarcina sp. P16a]PIC93010.1 acetyl-CoA C-acyltransferase [Sporosarcina sp. P25]
MTQAYIYDAIRTPRGAGKESGALASVPPIQLISTLIHALEERHSFDKALIEDFVLGCVTQVKDQGADLAKISALYARLPETVGGVTINRFCASGLDAVGMAAAKVQAGFEQVVLAGGVESVSRVPMLSDKGAWFSDPDVSKKTGFVQMGVSADIIASLEGFTREELDEYAVQSQERAAYARDYGYFDSSIVPVYDEKGTLLLANDELIRESTVDSLAGLTPSFIKWGVGPAEEQIYEAFPKLEAIEHMHHPGNSPSLADGAALLVVANEKSGEALGMKPRARIVGVANTSASPYLLTGGQAASHKVLAQTGLSFNDMDLIEYNEAFAATVLKLIRDEKIDSTKINVNGGAISMGHALGGTGGMLLATILDELDRIDGKYGLVAISGGGGVGTAIVVERI